MAREPRTAAARERGRRWPVLLTAGAVVLGALVLAGIWCSATVCGADLGPAEVDGPTDSAAPTPPSALDEEGAAQATDATDATGATDAADAPTFEPDEELTDQGLPGGTPSPQVHEPTGLRTDLLVLAADRGMLVLLDPSGGEASIKLDEETEYLDLAVRPGSSAADATVAVVADGPQGTSLEVVRVGGGRLLADPVVVAPLDVPPTGLVWADDGTLVAWTDGERLTAADVAPDGTPDAPVDLGAAQGWIAAWDWQDDGAATGTVTLVASRDDGGLAVERRRVTREEGAGVVLGEVVETTDRLVLDAAATDTTGSPVQWVIEQRADQVLLSITGDEDVPVATVPVTAAPGTYVVGGGVAVVVTDMGSNDGIQRVTVDGAVTEIALWRAYDVLD